MSERTLEKFWALSSNSLFASESMAGVVFKDDSFVYLVLLVLIDAPAGTPNMRQDLYSGQPSGPKIPPNHLLRYLYL